MAFKTIPSAYQFSSLGIPSARTRIYYEQGKGVPIDGSNEALRSYSPFVIRLVPPAIFGVDGNVDVNAGGESVLPNGVPIELDPTTDRPDVRNVNLITTAAIKKSGKSNSSETLSNFLRDAESRPAIEGVVAGEALRDVSKKEFEPFLADKQQLADIKAQLKAFLDTPPLTFLINPTNMSLTYTKVQNYSERSRSGYIYQVWGEELPSMSFSGRIGAFISGVEAATGAILIEAQNGKTPNPSGVQFASKRDSASFQHLMNIFTIYKNNGYLYDNTTGAYSPMMAGYVAIDYDGWTYLGHFKAFSYGYSSENMHGGLQFDCEFGISSMYDNYKGRGPVVPYAQGRG